MRIVWTEPALRDLASLRAYIGRDKIGAANRQLEIVIAAVANLARFPDAGRLGRCPGTRELVIGRTPYLVAYRSRGELVDVLRVLHGRQRWPDRL